jgi:hypothetical protein
MVTVFGILLVAAGAVLVWAIDETVYGVETSTIGVILMAVGGIGAIASLLLSARATSERAPDVPGRDAVSPVGVEEKHEEETPPFARWPH